MCHGVNKKNGDYPLDTDWTRGTHLAILPAASGNPWNL